MELYKHQENILNLLSTNKYFGIFAEQGTGKTLPTLIHISNLFMSGKIKSCLVVAPISALGSWQRDIEKLSSFRREWCNRMTFVNYDKLSRKGSKYRTELTRHWDCIVLDEAHAIKERTSNRTKWLMTAGKTSEYKYILTGTPLANGHLENFYSLCNFLNPDTFPKWAEFEARYLKTFQLPGSFVKIITGYRNQDELLDTVSKMSIRIFKKDCLDLPDKMDDMSILVDLAEKSMYKEALDDFIESLDIIIDRPIVRLIKLRQLVSGHIKDEKGETIKLKTNKLKVLEELIESISAKTVIFYEFTESMNQICSLLDKKKIKYVTLNGEQKDKNIWRKFQEDESIQVIICQYLSANAGIDLYESNHTIYYEPNLSTTVISQSKDRTHRIGVKNPCNYYWLITKDTIEEDIYNTLQKQEDFTENVLLEIMKKRK